MSLPGSPVDLIVETGRIVARDLPRPFRHRTPAARHCRAQPACRAKTARSATRIRRWCAPAVERLKAEGIDARGPLPADSLFHAAARASYDVALAMYHDQALIPIKTLAFDHAVNVTLGLPFVRTSPDHGTAFDIAGTGRADPASLIAALQLAATLSSRPPVAPGCAGCLQPAKTGVNVLMSAIDDLPPLREVIRRHGLSAKKSLGQNFLLDLNLTARIARAAGPLDGVEVVEIGPGPGGLTRALLAAGARRVIAVERDDRAIAALAEIAARYPGRLEVVAGDALDFDPRACSIGAPARVVANLPYNIATALLVAWLTLEPWPPWYDRLVLMFQREVAERIVAAPGSKSYGRLSVLVGWRCRSAHPVRCRAVSAFVPPPKVTSSLVELVPRASPARLRASRARAGDGSGIRPTPQDAAPEPEIARRRYVCAA